MGQDNVVGIATHYGPDCPGIESQWGKTFRNHPDQPPVQWVPGLFRA